MKITGTTIAIILAALLNIALYSYIRVHYGVNDWILIGAAIGLGLLGCFFGRQYDKVKASAEIDTLTDVYNRRYVRIIFLNGRICRIEEGRSLAYLSWMSTILRRLMIFTVM